VFAGSLRGGISLTALDRDAALFFKIQTTAVGDNRCSGEAESLIS
jgi:hypothetical protein